MRAVIAASTLVILGACSSGVSLREIPVGGVREPIVRENLAAARSRTPGGLLEPGWLPDDLVLVSADYIGARNGIETVDLKYLGQGTSVHIWQTHATPEELGDSDPVPLGRPLDGTNWRANALPAAQVGEPGLIEYSTRLADGRTVTVDTNLDEETARRILASLELRGAPSES